MPKDMPNVLSAVQRPVDTANGMTNAHYVGPDTFAWESEAVLKSTWAGLAVTADVPENGDAKPVEFLGIPLLLIRDRDGDVRVFENICRHRGMILVQEPKKMKEPFAAHTIRGVIPLKANWSAPPMWAARAITPMMPSLRMIWG